MNKTKNQYEGLYKTSGSKYGIDGEVLARQGFAESTWRANAVGTEIKKYKGTDDQNALGIAQFLPSTAKRYGLSKEDLMNPDKSIDAQAQHMAYLKKFFKGDMNAAVAAYNWGEGNVQKHLKKYGQLTPSRLPEETRNYLEKVTGNTQPKPTQMETQREKPMAAPIGTIKDSAADQAALMSGGAVTEARRAETLGQRQYDEASYGDVIAASFRRTNSLNAWMENQEATEGYSLSEMTAEDVEWLKEEGIEGADADFIIQNWHGKEAAKNQAELLASRHADNEMASRGGVVQSFLLDAATSFTDPANLAMSLVPGGALLKGAKMMGYANRSRAALITSHAAVGGVSNIVGDEILSQQLGMESDPVVNAAVGAVLGALGGAWARHTTIPANADRLSGVEAAVERAQMDATANQLEMQGIPADNPVRANPSDQNVFSPTVGKLVDESVAKSYGWRFDAIGRVMKAPHEGLRKIMAMVSPDPTGRVRTGRTVEEHASDVDMIRRTGVVSIAQVADKHMPGVSKKPEQMMRLNDEAVRAVIDTSNQVYKNSSPVVKEMADAMRKYWKENSNLIGDAKLLKQALNDPHYFYMPVNQGKVQAGIKRFGSLDKLKSQLKEWAVKAVDSEYLDAQYEKAFKKHEAKHKDDPNYAGYMSPNDFKAKWAEGWASTKMDTGILNMERASKDDFTSNPNFLEHAAKMNRGMEIMGIDGQPFSLTNLTTTNFWEASAVYTSSLKGHYGVKMAYGSDLNSVLNGIRDACNEMRAKGDTGAAAKYEKQAREALSTAMGISPYASDSVFHRTLSTLRSAEHFKLAGGFGLNAAGEALGAVATMGLRSAFRIFGGLEATIKGAQKGDRQAIDTLKFMERVYGYDEMRLNLIDHSGYGGDFYRSNTDMSTASTLDKAAYAVNRGAQWANRATGFETFQRRTMEGLRLHLYEELQKAAKGDASNGFMKHLTDERIGQYGINRKDLDGIFRDAGKFSRKDGSIDADKWMKNNMESFLDMKTLLGRMAGESIQKHSLNDLPTFMQHPVAQTLFQFMTFPVAAFSRNTLKSIRDRDSVAAMKVLGTSIGASLVYSSRMAINSLEQEDPQAYRDEKMSLDRIALVGFSRSSFASVIPSATNSVLPFDIPGLADARTTGNSNSFLGGAVVNDADRMIKLARSSMAFMSDDDFEFSDSDQKAGKQLMLPNWLGTGLVYSKIGEAFGD